MTGYIFLADEKTEDECLERLLFGTKDAKFAETFGKIEIGDYLFLFNYSKFTLRGPFQAASEFSKGIEADAWGGRFKYQVIVNNSIECPVPLTGEDLEGILKFGSAPYYAPTPVLGSELLEKLFRKFSQTNPTTQLPENPSELPPEALSSYFIFRCNRVTGGTVWHDNVVGAPASQFRPVVNQVQRGDVVFVWEIEAHRLFGVWRATSRGQWNPGAFPEMPGRFPAVVYCDRLIADEQGLDEATVRRLAPFDGPFPRYKLTDSEGTALLQEFKRSGNLPRAKLDDIRFEAGKYRAEDGHWVQSQGELLIDNWLYWNGLLHAYAYQLEKLGVSMECDFCLPENDIYLEYWGLIGKPDYDQRRKRKLNVYREANLKLVEVFPKDLTVLSEILKKKLTNLGVAV